MNSYLEEFVHSMIQSVPCLQSAVEEHLGYYEELLPHVLMGNLTRWITLSIGEHLAFGEKADYHCAIQLLQFIEGCLGENRINLDEGVFNLLTVSFAESCLSYCDLASKSLNGQVLAEVIYQHLLLATGSETRLLIEESRLL